MMVKTAILTAFLSTLGLFSSLPASAASCDDKLLGHSWHTVELGVLGLPKNRFEIVALIGKRVTMVLEQRRNFNRREVLTGTLQQVPVFLDNDKTAYILVLDDGTTRNIDETFDIKELKVALPVSTVTHDQFQAKYEGWHQVEVGYLGLPKKQIDLVSLLNKQVSFYIEDNLDFNRREIVEGVVIQIPVFGDDTRTTYHVRLSDGTIQRLQVSFAIKEIRAKI